MNLARFLAESRLVLSVEDRVRIVHAFREAMLRGLSGAPSSIAMLPAYVPPCATPPPGFALALDAGGTNVRAALVRFDDEGDPHIEHARYAPLPGADGRAVDRETFFGGLADLVASVGNLDAPLGFVFSYPAEIRPDRDGVLLRWTKEIEAEGVEGTCVGRGLLDALELRHGARPSSVTVLNDTVAALAAGSTSVSGTGGNIGLIVGTGTNMAYFEQRETITKLDPMNPGPPEQAINMESGNFSELPMSGFDEALDAASADPGQQRFEKQVSGRYVGEVARRVLRGAGGKGLLAADTCHALVEPWSLTTAQVAAALAPAPRFEGPLSGAAPDDHRGIIRLLDAIVTRSAQLVACGLDAVISLQGLAAAPVGIVAEGTMFWEMPGYRERVETALDELAPPIGGTPRFVMLKLDDANLVGAAVAALS